MVADEVSLRFGHDRSESQVSLSGGDAELLAITEEAFDPQLNPLRAKVSLSMRVLSVNDLGFAAKGANLYLAYQALKEKGIADKVLVGAIDGGCQGVQNVKDGQFVATVMQFPKKMAEDGVKAVVEYAKSGTKPSGFIDTGATLITDKPVPGVESKDTTWGAANCWG